MSMPADGLSTILVHDFGFGTDGDRQHAILSLRLVRQQLLKF